MKKLLVGLCAIFICTLAQTDTFNQYWYNESGLYATTTCQTGGDINLPSTAPTKYGYDFVGWEKFPYTQIEYIESTGTQYIDTGIVPAGKKIQANIKFKYNDLTNNMALIGQRSMPGTIEIYRFAVFNDIFRFRINSDTIDAPIADTNIHIVELNGANGTIYDGTVLSSTQYTTLMTGTRPLRLFGINDSEATSPNLNGRVYYCKMFVDNVLVRDMIPVLDSAGTPCMYDKVTGRFFYNQGTGDFIAGPVLTE